MTEDIANGTYQYLWHLPTGVLLQGVVFGEWWGVTEAGGNGLTKRNGEKCSCSCWLVGTVIISVV